jgi:hypothetical protein
MALSNDTCACKDALENGAYNCPIFCWKAIYMGHIVLNIDLYDVLFINPLPVVPCPPTYRFLLSSQPKYAFEYLPTAH